MQSFDRRMYASRLIYMYHVIGCPLDNIINLTAEESRSALVYTCIVSFVVYFLSSS